MCFLLSSACLLKKCGDIEKPILQRKKKNLDPQWEFFRKLGKSAPFPSSNPLYSFKAERSKLPLVSKAQVILPSSYVSGTFLFHSALRLLWNDYIIYSWQTAKPKAKTFWPRITAQIKTHLNGGGSSLEGRPSYCFGSGRIVCSLWYLGILMWYSRMTLQSPYGLMPENSKLVLSPGCSS